MPRRMRACGVTTSIGTSALLATRVSAGLGAAAGDGAEPSQPAASAATPNATKGHRGVITSPQGRRWRSEEHTSELQSRLHLVCRLLLEKKKHHDSHLVLADAPSS